MDSSLHHTPPKRRRLRLRDESGAALVEFALILPVFALILFGALDLGKAYNYWIDENALKVCVYLPDGPAIGNRVRVEVTSTYRFMAFLSAKLNVFQKSIVADSTMRLERTPSYSNGDCA
jgi:hypothetical protein